MGKVPSLHIIPLTQDGITPLYAASLKGHSDVVNILTRNGADINLASKVCLLHSYQPSRDSLGTPGNQRLVQCSRESAFNPGI